MVAFLIILSSVLTIASAIPYIIEIIRGTTKPRIVSWFTWSVLTAIASAASFADGQVPGGIMLAFATLETALIVVLGWRYGDRKLARLDIVCLMGALVGLALWQVFDSPAIAIIATLTIDFIGAIPTAVHCWQKPHEETWLTFALAGLAGVCTVFAADNWQITAVAFPFYIAAINLVFAAVIVVRNRSVGHPEVQQGS